MTGYGRASASLSGRDITVEVRAVNHRYFDCTVKAGRLYGYLEDPVKKAAQARVARGKLDVFVTVDDSQSDDVEVTLNRHVFEAYLNSMRQMCAEYNLRDDISVTAVSRYPEVFTVTAKQADADELTRDVLSVLQSALDDFDAMREREGRKLADDILSRCKIIDGLVDQVAELSPASVKAYQEKLQTRIRELLEGAEPDEQRLLTEVALFADRIAVDEELVRLKSHLAQADSMCRQKNAVGRKLDFLVQEFNREANTIGSKCNDIEITRIVVDIKGEIEKIREQVQNIE
ncbi:MAG: YicC family protein [Ruminococcaceae bacterium]|nr:YicC family protein [Oscillospiraceae bacterium]